MEDPDLATRSDLSYPSWSRSDLLAVCILAVLGLAIYANSLPNDFVYDDRPICLKDERTRGLGRVEAIFTQGYWGTSDTSLDGLEGQPKPLYRPVTLLSIAVTHALVGDNAAVHRAVNLVLHAAICACVYVLCVIVFRQRVVAVVAGAVFAVHPVHTEAVIPIVGRSELLAAGTALGALILHLQDALKGRSGGLTWRYAATLVLFLIGVFSKESAITTAGLLVAADVWLKARGWDRARNVSWGRYLQSRFVHRYIGVLVVVACFLIARRLVLGQLLSSTNVIPVAQNVLMDSTLGQRLLTCLLLLAKYVYLLFIPHPLNYDYSTHAIEVQTSPWNVLVLSGVACLVAMTVAAVVSARRRRRTVVTVMFFVITYSVAANVLVRIGTLMAERLIYLPSVGSCMLLGLLAGIAVDRLRTPTRLRGPGKQPLSLGTVLVTIGLLTIVTVYGALTVQRNRVWRSNLVLYEDGVVTQPTSYRCWNNLGMLYFLKGDRQKGMECLTRALELAPNIYEILGRMGWEYTKSGRYEEALDLLTRAHENRWRSETFTLWVRAQLQHHLGRIDEAVRLYEEALAVNPKHQVSLINLSALCTDPDIKRHYDLNKAYDLALRATKLPAPQPQTYVALADACVKMNRRDEAVKTIRHGLSLLNAYRKKARQLGKLEQLASVYDKLEAALREMHRKMISDSRSPPAAP